MAVYYLYVYSPSDFTTGLPDENGAQADGSPTFTLTLNPGATPTLIAVEDDDLIFDEVDATQALSEAVNIDGTTFAAGTTINTAYDLINTGNGHKITSFHFGGDGYQQGAVDGIVSTVELAPGTSYTFNTERTSHQQNNAYSDFVACFASGTLIDTPHGPRPIETLRVGDAVQTVDHGPLPLTWVGSRGVIGVGALAPVRLPAGWNGLTQDILVSPQHRMLISGAQCEMLLGCDSALVPARFLAEAGIGSVSNRPFVQYHHIMFDDHQIVRANGAPSESLLASELGLKGFTTGAAEEIRKLFPELSARPMGAARRVLRAHEARMVVAA